MGRPADAEPCFRQALRVRPAFHQAHNNLGNVLKEQGRLDDAVAAYRDALRLKPDWADAQNNCWHRAGHDERHGGRRRASAGGRGPRTRPGPKPTRPSGSP